MKVIAPDDSRISLAEILRVLKQCWKFVRPYRSKFYLGILLLLLAVPLAQFSLFLTRDVTNKALLATNLSAAERWNTVLHIVTLQAIFYFSSAILSTGREVLEWYGSMRSTFDLRLAFYKHLHRLPLAYLARRLPGEHLFRATGDMVSVFRVMSRPATPTASGQSPPDSKEIAMAIYSNDVDPYDPGVMGLIVRTVPLLVETIYSLAWGVALLFLIDSTLSILLVLYIVPFALLSNALFNKIRHTAFLVKMASERESGRLRDSIAGLRTLKAIGRLKFQRKRYIDAVSHTRRRAIQQIAQMAMVQNGAQIGMKWAFSIGIYVYLGSQVMKGASTIGDWIAAFLLIEAAQGPLENFIQILQLVKVQLVPAQRIMETLTTQPTIVDKPNAKPMGAISGRIDFENVAFSYTPERVTLDGISASGLPGQFIGIVGPSGAGKSSLLALLLRLYVPTSGNILVDGADVSEIQIQTLLEQTGTVPQTTCLYSGTIADNIRFGNPKASDADVQLAADLSGVTSFVKRFPNGLETEVGEGATISGGERQRIGIARALVRNPKILVLDEATANLDPETEAEILDQLLKLRQGRTILSVAHRLKAVVPCDQIWVLENGKLVQSGTHEQLCATPGTYRDLWVEQTREIAAERMSG
ncbi:MAG: ABC transporter ATP-binding protein [Armatimonadetes bacterium]|nr:ABC transporter ATP-binding protein [Armatimonadota bacterium]